MNDKTLSCTMSGMGSSAAIKWIDPDNVDVPTNDPDNYVVVDGISGFNPTGGTQTTQLTIKAQKLRTLNSAGTWKCSVTPSQYAGSPASQGTVTVTPIGKCFLCIRMSDNVFLHSRTVTLLSAINSSKRNIGQLIKQTLMIFIKRALILTPQSIHIDME